MPVHRGKELQQIMRQYSSMKALQLLMALADCEGEVTLAELSARGLVKVGRGRGGSRLSQRGHALYQELAQNAFPKIG